MRSLSKMRIELLLPCALCAVCLSACGQGRAFIGRPSPTLERGMLISIYENDDYNIPKLVKEYYTISASKEDDRKRKRDEIIGVGFVLMNLRYAEFVEQFSITKKAGDTFTEIAVVALGATAALLNPSTTTSILAAASAGIVASNASVNKNFFYEQAVPVMIRSMDAQRNEIASEIIESQSGSTSEYSLSEALTDLDRYYAAGTFEGALDAISQQASEKNVEAKDRIKELRKNARLQIAETRKLYESWLGWISNSRHPDRLDRAVRILIGRLSVLTESQRRGVVYASFFDRIDDKAPAGEQLTTADAQSILGGTKPSNATKLDLSQLDQLLRTGGAGHKDYVAALLSDSQIREPVPAN